MWLRWVPDSPPNTRGQGRPLQNAAVQETVVDSVVFSGR
jgi:hypothetical protein